MKMKPSCYGEFPFKYPQQRAENSCGDCSFYENCKKITEIESYKPEVEKFKSQLSAMKFVYVVVFLVIIVHLLSGYVGEYKAISTKLSAVEKKIDLLLPAEKGN